MVLAGTVRWQTLEKFDEWHAKATEDNQVKIANYLARCLKELPLLHFQDMTLPDDGNPQPLDQSTF
eukprot:5719519-Karenia_brevis.AAC.1